MSKTNGRPVDSASASSLLDPPESTSQPEPQPELGSPNHPFKPLPDVDLIQENLPMPFLHTGWEAQRRRVYASLHRTGQKLNRLFAFKDCGTNVWLFRSKADPTIYRVGSDRCRDRFCTPCQTDRGRRIVRNMTQYLGKRTVRFITLTLAGNTDSLVDRLKHLSTSFAKLRRRALWKRAVSGGVAFLEVKRTKDAERWHPHLHCIVTGCWIDAKRLRKLWHEITGDSFIVDVQLVRSQEKLARYVVKYVSKPLNTSFINQPEYLDEAVTAMHGRKLVTAWGTFADLQTTAQPDDVEWEPVLSLADLHAQAANGDLWATDLLQQFHVAATATTSLPPPTMETHSTDADAHRFTDVQAQSRFNFATPTIA